MIAGHENGEINQYSAKVCAFCFSYTTIQKFGVSQIFFLQINTFIQQRCIKLTKSNSTLFIVTSNICCSFERSNHQRIFCHVATKILCRTTVFKREMFLSAY